jgi:eukaryotic-like serine/threonine-protein kinase
MRVWKEAPTELGPGVSLGPYEIVSLLGAGGMGQVYRARDSRLGRDVAIKVLPADFAADVERLMRFEREAKATGSLSHPNILAVHDVGTVEGVPYLVEELLEGESLKDRLERGALTVPEAVETAVQVAHGLAAAHEKHIVHRDLKPGNLFITKDGIVKILDFGLAKLVTGVPLGDAETLTQAPSTATEFGRVLGTLAYMAPEQARGLPVDPRSDIFTFGVVLYEMLSGQRPFRGETATDTVAAILTQPPLPLPDRVPPTLKRIVGQCLEKLAERRFSSAHDLALALQAASTPEESVHSAVAAGGADRFARRRRVVGLALTSAAVLVAAGVLVLKLTLAPPSSRSVAPPKIVVLAFENLGSPEDAYFAAGMTEEITSRLANVQGLGVISRTSAVEYTHRGKTVKEIGSELGVDYVLEGSVRYERSGAGPGRVRITPQLIRVADDTHVWTDRYDRVIADVFGIQSEVAENAVKAMGVAVLPRERAALNEVSTNDMEAYDLYLRGKELASRGANKTDYEGAAQMYQAALDRDPHFAQALAGLVRMHLAMYWFYFDRNPDRIARAKEAAERAVELRPDLAESHTSLGWYFYWGLLDFPGALGEFDAALKIQPKSSDALLGVGAVVRRQGRWAESAETIGKAVELDPRNAQLLFEFGLSSVYARRYADADHALGVAIALNPKWAEPYAEKARLQVQWRGDLEKAQAVLDEAERVAGLADDEQALAASTFELTLYRRDYPRALRQLEGETRRVYDNQTSYSPISLLRGQVQRLAGQDGPSRRCFETARLELEQKMKQDPDDPRVHGSLAIAFAGLGRRTEAVREAKLGCDLVPASKGYMDTLDRLGDLALVYMMVGQTGEAFAGLDSLLAGSGACTPRLLRLDPNWDPLRPDPRFQALLAKYEVKP